MDAAKEKTFTRIKQSVKAKGMMHDAVTASIIWMGLNEDEGRAFREEIEKVVWEHYFKHLEAHQ